MQSGVLESFDVQASVAQVNENYRKLKVEAASAARALVAPPLPPRKPFAHQAQRPPPPSSSALPPPPPPVSTPLPSDSGSASSSAAAMVSSTPNVASSTLSAQAPSSVGSDDMAAVSARAAALARQPSDNISSTYAGSSASTSLSALTTTPWAVLQQQHSLDPSCAHSASVATMCVTAERCKRLCVDDGETMSNSNAMRSCAQSVLDFCADHKSRLCALEFHAEIERAVTTLHTTLSRAASVLEEALQTNWRRNAKFKAALGPLINEAQGNLTSLGTSLAFAALELGHGAATANVSLLSPPISSLSSSTRGGGGWNAASGAAALAMVDRALLEGDRAFFGHGVTQSYEHALRCYVQAAEMGSSRAMCSLASMYRCGRGCQPSIVLATAWLEKACTFDDADAQNLLAEMLDVVDASSQVNSGSSSDSGGGRVRGGDGSANRMRAMQLYARAAGAGHAEAQTNLGHIYEHGLSELGIESDESAAMDWYQKAALQNNARAQNNLGVLLHRQNQFADSVKWFKLAAAQGHAAAQNNLGMCYETGAHGILRPSLDMAGELFADAAAQGHIEASTNLGYVWLRKREFHKALHCFTRAVEHNSAAAMFHMGQIFECGLGVEKSMTTAFAYFERAAKLGHAKSMVRCGNCLFAGVGVERDVVAAFEHYKCAAARGLNEGKNQLGLLFLHGLGTVKDCAEARFWFESASANGDGDATFNLAGMYAHGEGVDADAATADALFVKASEQGSSAAKQYLLERERERQVRESVLGIAATTPADAVVARRIVSRVELAQVSTDVAFRILRQTNFKLC